MMLGRVGGGAGGRGGSEDVKRVASLNIPSMFAKRKLHLITLDCTWFAPSARIAPTFYFLAIKRRLRFVMKSEYGGGTPYFEV